MVIDLDEFKIVSHITRSTGSNLCVDNLPRVLIKNIVTLEEANASAIFRPEIDVWVNRLIMVQHQELNWARFEPCIKYPIHSHSYEQISVVIQGHIKLTVGEETREVGLRDVWHAQSDVPHEGEILGNEAVIFFDVCSPIIEGHDG